MPQTPSDHESTDTAILSSTERERRVRTWPLVVVAFSSLLLLITISGTATLVKARELYKARSDLNQRHRQDAESLGEIKSAIQVSSIMIRDYLLDPSLRKGDDYRDQIVELRRSTAELLAGLEKVAQPANRRILADLKAEVHTYWQALDPVFEWEPEEKQAFSYSFLRRKIMPRREFVTKLAAEVKEYTDRSFLHERDEIAASEQAFTAYVRKMLLVSLLLGIGVAVLSVARISNLERRSEQQRLQTTKAEQEMRRLSHQLVHGQEQERRKISRELHDEVGQMLTGLRMEFRSLQKVHLAPRKEFEAKLEQGRAILDKTLQAVRDIAMGLRPSMLDDLGLEAALQWQARDFSRRHDIPVAVNIRAKLADLPEEHRTTLYRIVQEALTNCARHARAKTVSISLTEGNGSLRLEVSDDGIGMPDHDAMAAGLGLLGIQERVRELGGHFEIRSTRGRGTLLVVDVPEDVLVA
ncbi:MAG: ATP-binding protein [Bryobacteraceae bacterium]